MRLEPNFTHGDVLRARRVRELTLVEVRYPAGTTIRSHAHANARFVLVRRGCLEETGASGERSFPAGSLLFRPAGSSHAVTCRAVARASAMQSGIPTPRNPLPVTNRPG